MTNDMLEAIAEHDPELILLVAEHLDEKHRIELLERLGFPVISAATRNALKDVSRRLRLGVHVGDDELHRVEYAVGVSLEAVKRRQPSTERSCCALGGECSQRSVYQFFWLKLSQTGTRNDEIS